MAIFFFKNGLNWSQGISEDIQLVSFEAEEEKEEKLKEFERME